MVTVSLVLPPLPYLSTLHRQHLTSAWAYPKSGFHLSVLMAGTPSISPHLSPFPPVVLSCASSPLTTFTAIITPLLVITGALTHFSIIPKAGHPFLLLSNSTRVPQCTSPTLKPLSHLLSPMPVKAQHILRPSSATILFPPQRGVAGRGCSLLWSRSIAFTRSKVLLHLTAGP